jgi:hypothetical protein
MQQTISESLSVAGNYAQQQPLLIRRVLVVEFPLVAAARRTGVIGLWRSLVAHLTGGQGVASSNLASPTLCVLVGGDFAPSSC